MSAQPASASQSGTAPNHDQKDADKITTSPAAEFPSETSSEELHFATRKEDLLPDEYDEKQQISGYDPALMRARVLLSAEEEKKLLRRIDWRLIPLLSVMYMVKTIDAMNVSSIFKIEIY